MNWTSINLSAVHYFIDAVEHGGLAPSAAKNFVTPPAISQALRRLEEQLGFHLLVHKKRSFTLSIEGRRFYERARVAVENFERAMEVEGVRELRLAASATLAEYVVLPMLRKLGVDGLSLQIGPSSRVRQNVREGEARVGFLIDDDKNYGFDTHVVREGQFELRSLSGRSEDSVFVTEDRPEVARLMRTLGPKGVKPVRIESWSIAQRFAEALGGMSWVPDLIPRGKMKRVALPALNHKYRVIAITRANAASTAELQFLESVLKR